jgi:hypothetical protein
MNSSRTVLALLANVALATTACGVFGSDTPTSAEPATQAPAPDADGGVIEGPKAPPITGPAAQNELTDELGIFVASNGLDIADGTHGHPLATIQAGIDKAKTVGKRVYVCAGLYKQALVIADSISVIGGLDCTNNEWRTGTGVSRIESPTSPAMRAKDIKSATRLEGLDVTAPNATAPGGSSIGLLADHAAALVVARSKIVAGNAMKGDDGGEGIALSNAATVNGSAGLDRVQCVFGAGGTSTCAAVTNVNGSFRDWNVPALGVPGSNACVGAPNHVAEAGGRGGNGGLHEYGQVPVPGTNPPQTMLLFHDYAGRLGNAAALYATANAPDARTGAPGIDGTDGKNGAATGTLSADGYVPADGTNGSDGATGSGGAGGNGADPTEATPKADGAVWRGWGGAGGGAGGCPGLAGKAGKGGGASIAALLIEGAVTFDGSELVAGQGGTGGLGALGSPPTAGGAPGNNPRADIPALSGKPGGRGGAAGISGNGGSGPSAGIAHVGAAPNLVGANKIAPGAGGAEIQVRSRTDGLGVTKTVPATPAGASKAILPL